MRIKGRMKSKVMVVPHISHQGREDNCKRAFWPPFKASCWLFGPGLYIVAPMWVWFSECDVLHSVSILDVFRPIAFKRANLHKLLPPHLPLLLLPVHSKGSSPFYSTWLCLQFADLNNTALYKLNRTVGTLKTRWTNPAALGTIFRLISANREFLGG